MVNHSPFLGHLRAWLTILPGFTRNLNKEGTYLNFEMSPLPTGSPTLVGCLSQSLVG
jgi:hypothetical protein